LNFQHRTSNIDGFVKSLNTSFDVIPAKADILSSQFICHGLIFFKRVRPNFSHRFIQNLGPDLIKQLTTAPA